MTAYETTLTENMSLNPSVNFMGGSDSQGFINLNINGNDYSDRWETIEITEVLNEPPTSKVTLFGATPEMAGDIRNYKTFKIYYSDTVLIKANILGVDYDSDEDVTLNGTHTAAIKLMNYDTGTGTSSYRKTSTATNTMVSNLCSVDMSTTNEDIVAVGTNDYTTARDFRAESINRLQALKNLAKINACEIWFNTDGSDNDQFNFSDERGTGSSVKTFYTYGTNQNCSVCSRTQDTAQLWNKVKVLGYGDGSQQIEGSFQENGASQSSWGIRTKIWTDRSIKNVNEANALAAAILADHKDPINKFVLELEDVTDVLPTVNVGDTITINDNTIFQSGEGTTYKVIRREIIFSPDGESVRLECASRTYQFVQEVAEILDELDRLDKMAQINDPGHTHPGDYSVADHLHTEYAPIDHQHEEKKPDDHQHGEKIPKTHVHTYNAPANHAHPYPYSQYLPLSLDQGTLPDNHTHTQNGLVTSHQNWDYLVINISNSPRAYGASMRILVNINSKTGTDTNFYVRLETGIYLTPYFPDSTGQSVRVTGNHSATFYLDIPTYFWKDASSTMAVQAYNDSGTDISYEWSVDWYWMDGFLLTLPNTTGDGSAQTSTGSVTNFGIDDANVIANSGTAADNVVANHAKEAVNTSLKTGGTSSGTSDPSNTGITG